MQSCGDDQGAFQLGKNHLLNQFFCSFCMPYSVQCIIHASYRIPIYDGMAVEIYVAYKDSQFPGYLVYEQDGVITLRFLNFVYLP